MALNSGTRLGSYEIVALIGSGGMGEVYRARDTRLNRDVAIKVLPDAFAHDADRLARFKREAQMLASLNHPHIAAIYGIEESAAGSALILELVEGPTLADRIVRGSIPLDEALPIARQIAEALEAAHEQGIIHRDLKPANIKLAADGQVKVLDFGLAKAADPSPGHVLPDTGRNILSQSPTFTSPLMTMGGAILGTAAYMSPEQAKGKPVDKRADMWAFGCVLYEMLTGRVAFPGEGVSETLAEVLKSDPDWRPMPADVPEPIARLLRRCLAKDPRSRISDAGVARLEINDALNPPSWSAVAGAPALRSSRPSRLAWGVAIAALLVAAGMVALSRFYAEPSVTLPTGRFIVSLPITSIVGLTQMAVSVSPDGQHIAYTVSDAGPGRGEIWIRGLDALQPRVVPGAAGGAYFPFWSPDGRQLGFFHDAKVKRVALAGGTPETISDARGAIGGSWNRDGIVLIGRWEGGILQVPAGGGDPKAATALNAAENGPGHLFPQFLPDGRRFIYISRPDNTIHLASLDSSETRELLKADSQALYVTPGYLVFVRQGTMLAQPFDAAQGTLTGSPVQIASEVVVIPGLNLAEMSVSQNGVLAYRSVEGVARPASQLVWLNRQGHKIGEIPGEFDDRSLSLSHDAPFVAVDKFENAAARFGSRDIWMVDYRRGTSTKLTPAKTDECCPISSPDGRRVIFSSSRDGQRNLFEVSADGLEPPKLLLKTGNDTYPKGWSRDGRFIAFEQSFPGQRDLWVLPLAGERTPIPVARTSADESGGRISPDGKSIAYVSNQSGRYEVYVQSLVDQGRRRLQVSTDGGFYPRWRADGREIFYASAARKLVVVTVDDTTPELQLGIPTPLFDLPISNPALQQFTDKFDVTADGQRFLVFQTLDERTSIDLTVVTNWMTALQDK